MTGQNPSPGNSDKRRKGRPVQTKYGAGSGAEIDSDAEETERQEYDAEGLPRTQKYSVDKSKKD